MFKYLSKNTRGNILLMSLLMLSGILVVAMGASSLVISSIKLGRSQKYSTVAYFATEAGLEKALWQVRNSADGFDYNTCPAETECAVDFGLTPPGCSSDCDAEITETLDNGSVYSVKYKAPAVGASEGVFTATGFFTDAKRSVAVNFKPTEGEKIKECVPNCEGRTCGSDGCGGSCGACTGELKCVLGTCMKICIPNCADKECGANGCGGTCSPGCFGQDICMRGTCVCLPDCAGRICGTDGCAGICGPGCSEGYDCHNGDCIRYCTLKFELPCVLEKPAYPWCKINVEWEEGLPCYPKSDL